MILVTGATSILGRAIVRQLASEGRHPRCLLRPEFGEQHLPPGLPLSAVSASLNDPPALRAAMQCTSCVVHVVGEERFGSIGAFVEHTQGTTNLVEAMRDTGVARLVHLSRLGADCNSAYAYLRIRGEAERIVRQSGLDYTILQAPLAYGHEDVSTTVLAMVAKIVPLVLPVPDTGRSCFQPLCIPDLARCVASTPDRRELVGQTIPLAGPEHFTLHQLIAQVLAAAGVHRRIVHLRLPVMQTLVRLLDQLLPHNPVPSWWLDVIASSTGTDLGSVPRHFGFEPRRFVQGSEYLSQKRAWRRELIRIIRHGSN